MNIEEFIKNFSELFEETDPNNITRSARFRDFDEWSSLLGLAVIAMVDRSYHIKLTGLELKNAQTVEDIFKIIQLRKSDSQAPAW